MKIQRNYNMDLFRAVAVILVVMYHSWVLTGSIEFRPKVLHMFIQLGGEIGVTIFFALSGYGIFCSLKKMEASGGLYFWMFLKKRCKRIMPQYYFCLVMTLLLMDGAYYLSEEQMINVMSHIFFLHNLHPHFHGAINGVLWTMGVIVQFYLIAIPLYRWISNHMAVTLICSAGFTICMKAFLYAVVIPNFKTDDFVYFFVGRQIITALDNFTVGMAVACMIEKRNIILRKWQSWMLFLSALTGLGLLCRAGLHYGIHTNNLSGYVWHSLLALMIMGLMAGGSFIKIDYYGKTSRIFLWVAKYEYGIYLWHLLFINNLVHKAPMITSLSERGHFGTVFLIFLSISVILGYFMTCMTDFVCKGCK